MDVKNFNLIHMSNVGRHIMDVSLVNDTDSYLALVEVPTSHAMQSLHLQEKKGGWLPLISTLHALCVCVSVSVLSLSP